MKKEDQFPRNDETVSFEDADYTDAMRVDPLTAREQIREELSELEKQREARKKEADQREAEKKAEEHKQALMDELRKELADDSGSPTNAE